MMKKTIKGIFCLMLSACMLGALLTGCSKENEETPQPPESSAAGSALPPDESAAEPVPETQPETEEEQPLLYIGTVKAGFETYPAGLEGELTADKLIQAMSELTGWNLALSDSVSSGKGGMAVTFAPECALVTGPPENQKEEFFAYDNYTLAQLILDSIQETLRQNFVAEPGDPANLDIWFSMEDEPIVVEGVTVRMDEPWDEQEPFG